MGFRRETRHWGVGAPQQTSGSKGIVGRKRCRSQNTSVNFKPLTREEVGEETGKLKGEEDGQTERIRQGEHGLGGGRWRKRTKGEKWAHLEKEKECCCACGVTAATSKRQEWRSWLSAKVQFCKGVFHGLDAYPSTCVLRYNYKKTFLNKMLAKEQRKPGA